MNIYIIIALLYFIVLYFFMPDEVDQAVMESAESHGKDYLKNNPGKVHHMRFLMSAFAATVWLPALSWSLIKSLLLKWK